MTLKNNFSKKERQSSYLNDSSKNKIIVFLVVNDFTCDSRVLKEARSAVKSGFKVWIICRKSPSTNFRESKDGFTIIRVQSWLDKLWVKYKKNKVQDIAGSQSQGAPKFLITYLALINTWLINKLFIEEAFKIKPDIIHANDSTTLPAALKLKVKGISVVYDAHELYSESLEKPNFIWKKFFVYFEKKIKKLDGIFSVNKSILNELDRRYLTKNLPKQVIYNAPEYIHFTLNKRRNIRLLYLGHYMPGRGLEKLFEAIEQLPDITLSIYGNGFGNIKSKRIIVCPPVSTDKVLFEAKKYDIGLIPYEGKSMNHLYSTPNKLFDYMTAGLAIAASNLPEIKKIIDQNQNGIIFNPKDPNDIAQKINYLIQNPNKLYQLKQNSLKYALNYSWEKQAEKQIKLYDLIMRKPDKDRVFLGPLDFGLNQIFKNSMGKLGYQVTTCSFVQHHQYGWKNDIELKINQVGLFKAIDRVIRNFTVSLNYDIYHFKFGQSLLPWNLDLPLLKIMNKKIIMNFHGLDIRQLDRFQKDEYNKLLVNKIGYKKIKELKKRLRHWWIKNWVDKIVVSTPDLLEFAPEAEYIPEMADANKIENRKLKNFKKNKIFKILHAPSHRGIKGTEYIIKAIENLNKQKYSVDLLLAENIPANRMKNYFNRADIVIDQLLIGSYGVVGIEGMLAGKPIVCYLRKDLRKFYPKDLPIVTANPKDLLVVLEKIIKNKKIKERLGKQGYQYVRKYHHPEILARRWCEIYNKL